MRSELSAESALAARYAKEWEPRTAGPVTIGTAAARGRGRGLPARRGVPPVFQKAPAPTTANHLPSSLCPRPPRSRYQGVRVCLSPPPPRHFSFGACLVSNSGKHGRGTWGEGGIRPRPPDFNIHVQRRKRFPSSAISAVRNDDMQVPARSLAIRHPDRLRRGSRDAGGQQGSSVG